MYIYIIANLQFESTEFLVHDFTDSDSVLQPGAILTVVVHSTQIKLNQSEFYSNQNKLQYCLVTQFKLMQQYSVLKCRTCWG